MMATMMSNTTDPSKSPIKSDGIEKKAPNPIVVTPKSQTVYNQTLLTTSTRSSIASTTITSSSASLLTKTPNTPWYLNRKARNNNNNNSDNSNNSSNNCNTSNTSNNTSSPNTNNNNPVTIPTPNNNNINDTNFLPTIGQQAFFQNSAHPQGIALASVQSQLQPGSVVFASPTVAMATLAGTAPTGTVQQNGTSPAGQIHSHPQQQIVVTPTGQLGQIGGTFQANGQTHQFIQAPGMNMMGGIPQVQLIGANGQQYFPYSVQMQPVLTMAIPPQNPGQNITLIPTNQNANGSTILATTPMTQVANPTTPVKNNNNQTIVKGVNTTISPQQQQQQQVKNNSNNIVSGKNNTTPTTTPQANMQQQTATFQQNPNNQTFLIGIPHSTTSQNGTTTLLQTTPTNARKNMHTPQMIHKIQSTTQPILTQTQFKSNASFSGTPNSSGSPNQTIMVQGQGIPTGSGSIQITNTPTILSSFNTPFQTIQPSIVNFSPQLNQQPMTALTQNGQIVQIRTQNSNDSPQMYIQTSNTQFQAVPVQMTSGNQPQSQNNASMQMTQACQPIMTSSLNHQLPISIQTNHNQGTTISSTTMITNSSQANNQTNTTPSNTSSITTATTMASTANRQRPLRPASSPQQSSISTQTTSTKPKTVESNRTSGTNIPKLAPKASTIMMVSSSNSIPKLPLPPLPKTSENNGTVVSSSPAGGNLNIISKTSTAKINTSTQSVSSSTVGTTSSSSPFLGLKVNNASNLVSGTIPSTGLSKFDNNNNNKSINNKKTEKKDAASSTENNKVPMTTIPVVSNSNKSLKNNPNVSRNNTNINTNNTNNSTNSNSNINNSQNNTNLYNGNLSSSSSQSNNNLLSTSGSVQAKSNVLTPINSNIQQQQQPLSKNSNINNNTNSVSINKSGSTNNTKAPSSKSSQIHLKSKQFDPVLTHIIDDLVIHESPLPFPIEGFLIKNEIKDDSDYEDYKKGQNIKTEDSSIKTENMEPKNENDDQNLIPIINNNGKESIAMKSKENNMKNSLQQQQQNDSNSESNSNCNNSIETSKQQPTTAAAAVQQQNSLNQQSTQQSTLQPPPSQQQQFNLDLCLQCRKNERIKNSEDKKWNKYCLTCAEKLFRKQQSMTNFDKGSLTSTQVSSSSVGASIPPTTAPCNSSIANVVANGLNGVHHTENHQSNQIPCSSNTAAINSNNNSNGLINNMKRPLNQVTTTTDERQQFAKQPRPNDMRQTMPSNLNSDSQATISNGTNGNNQEGGMWLPEGGKKHPDHWKDQDVYQFLIHMEGCPAYVANNFLAQEVDGKAMLLVNEGHVIDWGQTKLGPALKICQKIKELKALFDC